MLVVFPSLRTFVNCGQSMSDFYIAKDVMTEEDVSYIYDYLINVCPWRINSSYFKPEDHDHEYFRHHNYPHMSALGPGGMQDPWLAGYFTATMAAVNLRMKETYGFTLPVQRTTSMHRGNLRTTSFILTVMLISGL